MHDRRRHAVGLREPHALQVFGRVRVGGDEVVLEAHVMPGLVQHGAVDGFKRVLLFGHRIHAAHELQRHASERRLRVLAHGVGLGAQDAAVVRAPRRPDEVIPAVRRSVALLRVDEDARVEELAGPGIVDPLRLSAETRICLGHPTHDVVTDVVRIPVRVVGLVPDHDRVADADLLERLVPAEQRAPDGRPVLLGDRVAEPEHHRMLGWRDRLARV